MAKIGIIGAGTWGTALAVLLNNNGHEVTIWSIIPEEVVLLRTKRQHEKILPGVILADMLGLALGGALKNVIALAAGMADGLGYGDNTKAALITRGIAEIARLGIKMGGIPETFYGLTGIGDLIVTCASVHSRNRKAGYLIGQGKSMQEAMDEVGMIVEGVYSAKAAIRLAQKYQVELPIIEQVNKILFEDKKAADALNDLMLRDPKTESDAGAWK